MPWCPDCRAEYRDGFFRCADCDVWLVNRLPPEEEEANTPPDPDEMRESWAQPTLRIYGQTDHLIPVHECYGRERDWPHDTLDDHGILYHIEIVPCWEGSSARPKYYAKQVISVEERDKDIALGLIDEVKKELDKGIEFAPIETDGALIDSMDEPLPQIMCPSCRQRIDFDYAICPLCKHRLQVF